MIDKVFGNRYRIIERIGIGGMAEVYRATDEVLGRTVAVKLMLPQYAADPTFAARFKQEAQAAANLQSPYIVNIYDWGRDDVDETFYIVMELVRGTDLKTAINQRGALNQRKAAEVASQVCAALSVAHGYDIIHRDIKPHNIMVQPDGNAKVMDFGIARANGSGMTQTGSVLGTAYYVSPEQAQGRELTPSTDLYSLGIVLYEAVTGKLPFEGPDAVTVALKQVNQQALPPSDINPDIDPDLEAIIIKAMSKNPADRYATADAMRTALNNYLAGKPIDEGIVDSQAATTVMGAMPSRRPTSSSERTEAEAQAAIVRRQPETVARTSVMPVAAIGNDSYTNNAVELSRKKNRRPAIVIGVLAALLVLSLVGFFVFSMLQDNRPDMVKVPDVIGQTESDATRNIRLANLEVGEVTHEASDTVAKDRVIRIVPAPNVLVERNSKIDLVVSSGTEQPVTKQVPNIINLTPDEARQLLDSEGFSNSYIGEKFHDSIEAGRVCEQSPNANSMAEEGSTVRYYVSKGKETSSIPSVVNQSADDAERNLFDAGFVVEFASTREYSDTVPAGSVIRQSPTAGTTAAKGTVVRLTLSDGPAQVQVPSVIGMTPEAATMALQAVGLNVSFDYQETTSSVDVGKVLTTSPSPSNYANKGSTVIVVIGKEVEVVPPTPSPTPGGP